MKFDAEWVLEKLENAPERGVVAEHLTACGFNVETRESSGDSEIWDVEVTTNRPDVMNHRGIAREAAVATGASLRSLEIELDEVSETSESLAQVEIDAPELCSRYVARVVRGVKIQGSPDWLKQRLERCGVRPINTVVDATNYVLLELGQPLHAFDLDLVAGRRIIVRQARDGELLTTLDGVERKLDSKVLVIADDDRAVALAGIMGGANSEIHHGSTDVLIESAHFDAVAVRRAARRLGMHTEASHRFERGCDPEMAAIACDAAAALIARLAGGTVCSGRIDAYPRQWATTEIAISPAAVSAFAGLEISSEQVIRIFKALEFEPRKDGDQVFCTVPPFRVDVENTADLYEEVIRHVGYDKVPSVLPVLSTEPGGRAENWQLIDRGRDAAVDVGLAEVVTYSFIDEADDELCSNLALAPDTAIGLENALAETQSTMRRSLLPGLLSGVRDSLNQGERSIAVFEQGRVFALRNGKPVEHERLAIALSNLEDEAAVDFLSLKGVVESVLTGVKYPPVGWTAHAGEWFDSEQSAVLCVAPDQVIGCCGKISKRIADRWGLRQDVYCAEIDLEAALEKPPLPVFQPLAKYPSVIADMTIEHACSLSFAELEAATRELASEKVGSVGFVTRYAGKGLEPGRVRTTLRLVYRDEERSLTQDEVNQDQENLRVALTDRLAVQLI
jgi:phenylalanyl-tRNA synthetase beta chain